MSLRARLSLFISLVFFTGMVLGVSFQISNAKSRVSGEVESTARLAYQLLQSLIPAASTGQSAALLQALREIDDVRHLDIQVLGPGMPPPAPAIEATTSVPGWFESLVRPLSIQYRHGLPAADIEILVTTNPADEIEEVWLESRRTLTILLVVLLLLNGCLFYTIGHWLKPVGNIVARLAEVEQGRLSGDVGHDTAMLPELRLIADTLDRLTAVLHESKAENDRLARRSLKIQEEERRHLSQELHDEMGQSISAIKAIALSLRNSVRGDSGVLRDGLDRIEAISSQISDRVRNMMGRLRPANLDELGLVPAVQHMVDDWNAHHQRAFCRFRASLGGSRLNDDQRIHLYRIVQEALTNSARHAGAQTVDVTLKVDGDGAVLLDIRDDGRGFNPDATRWGMGLKGMRERVEALGGEFRLSSSPGEGVRLQVRLHGHTDG